ncbi:NAD-dependent epimerase/dehydratase family protein [Sphingobacterium endophyticum]|uniref:NAD-dependent epimerase/dehydratase family protein n=1 Tax=Sphingobacterium endophyticum TaxID=2546448 RepID=UPI0012E1C1B3|nr:NAD-dependent epimerase/dehydratase family protein [Sphingobacterium endophyticum]
MKITITGMSGFVGHNLHAYLRNNNYIVKNLNVRENDWSKSFPLDSNALIHLAGKAHDTSNFSEASEYFKVNRDLTIELFDKFINSSVRDFFYFSSVKAVADTIDYDLIENVIGNPQTPYGRSKLEAEKYLLSKELPEGKRLFVIRPCMIHGPGNKGNLNLLFNIVKKGIPWPLGAFENQRSFLGIDNLCYLIKAMLENVEIESGVYNFADDKSISTNTLVSLISITLNKKSRILRINKRIIQGLVKIGDKISLPLNSERLKKLTESYVVSNQKIKDALDITDLPNTVEEGIIKTVTSFNR